MFLLSKWLNTDIHKYIFDILIYITIIYIYTIYKYILTIWFGSNGPFIAEWRRGRTGLLRRAPCQT